VHTITRPISVDGLHLILIVIVFLTRDPITGKVVGEGEQGDQ
jgi:hypothetical protein